MTEPRQRLSALARSISPSPTLAMNKRSREAGTASRPLIPMSLGEPDFHTPAPVKAAGIRAIEQNFTKYTAADGTSDLKGAILEKLRRENGISAQANQIVVAGGAKVATFAALQCILDPGDEVIIPTPYWPSYIDLVKLAGGTPVIVPTTEASGFKLTTAELNSVLGPRTRALILNSPSNPSGAVYDQDELRGFAEALADHEKIWVIADELYEHLYYTPTKPVSFAAAAPAISNRTITINGFSKGYCMTGWRLAFAVGPQDVMAAISNVVGQIQGSSSSIAQAAGVVALSGGNDSLEANRQNLRERRDLLVSGLNAIAGLSVRAPEGAFYVYANCSELIGRRTAAGQHIASDVALAEILLTEAGVSSVAGSAFGLSPYLRLSYALDTAKIVMGIERIDEFCGNLI
ncbi:pyridoxal phosphate-dependent aminotransferase [Bosea thiooxidans]|nr:pyridoxal phosphate-dependent aminotransferase [Bosea sp. (in: a-proteobacteria)]